MVHQYKQLTLGERYQIEVLNSLSISAREIEQKLKRFNGSFQMNHDIVYLEQDCTVTV